MRYPILLAVLVGGCSADTTDLWCASNFEAYRTEVISCLQYSDDCFEKANYEARCEDFLDAVDPGTWRKATR